jgi:molybdate transport system substrate-binding protein
VINSLNVAVKAASAAALLCLFTGVVMAQTSLPSPPLHVYAAGSLREAFTEIARTYTATNGVKIELTFGASGLLRERIEKGEGAQVFASADTEHPEKLFSAGAVWQKPVRMVSNKLCAIANPAVNVTPENLLTQMLSPSIKLGTSTPKSDPSGDYAWELFRRAEALVPGAYALLDAKALKLTGAPNTPQPPAGSRVKGTYAWLMDQGYADIFLTYCTNAIAARKEVRGLVVVALPPALEVGAGYGLTARVGDAQALQFAKYLLSPPAQAVFGGSGFGAP